MIYLLLADLAVVAHVLFVLFVVGGGLLVRRWPRMAWLHLPAVLWGVVIEFKGWVCPLTHLENRFRTLGGGAGYAGSFIEHYLEPLLYPPGLTVHAQVIMGAGLLAINAAFYGCFWWRSSRGRR